MDKFMKEPSVHTEIHHQEQDIMSKIGVSDDGK